MCDGVIPLAMRRLVAVSEKVRAAVDRVAERTMAAAGVPSSSGAARWRMTGVTPEEVSRLLLSGLVGLEDVDPLLGHLERRVSLLMTDAPIEDAAEHVKFGASVFMSEVQCVALGLLLAREEKKSAGMPNDHDVEGSCFCGCGRAPTPLEGSGSRPPAHESFACEQDVWPPVHGGYPGEVPS